MNRSPLVLAIPLLGLFFWLLLAPQEPVRRWKPLAALAPPEALACTPWHQVNAGAFGLPSNFDENGNPLAEDDLEQSYRGEEGFETLVYDGKLYLGMEADNHLGARLWRTRTGVNAPETQSDWEEVIAGSDGLPWGVEPVRQVDHIDSLAAFNGYLYASSANSGDPTGARIFRSRSGDPGSWIDALALQGPGFGDPDNENFKDMQVFGGQLCGGTWNETAGAQVWCTRDGETWQQKNQSGFGDPRTAIIWSTGVFEGALYVGAQNLGEDAESAGDDTALLYRTRALDGFSSWELVYAGELPSLALIVLEALDGQLYIAHPGPRGIRVFSSPSGDAGSWQPVGLPGLDGRRWNFQTVTDGAVLYRGLLHVAVANSLTGMRVWRTTGNGFWEALGGPEGAATTRFAAQLAVFNDSLYAWTSDYSAGQSVLQTSCKFEPTPGKGSRLVQALLLILGVAIGSQWLAQRWSRPQI